MKAWDVYHRDYRYDNEGSIVYQWIVHAETRDEARRIGYGIGEIGEDGYLMVRATRCPSMDDHLVTPLNMVTRAGWWYECFGCGITIRDDVATMLRPTPTETRSISIRWTVVSVAGTRSSARRRAATSTITLPTTPARSGMRTCIDGIKGRWRKLPCLGGCRTRRRRRGSSGRRSGN